MKKGKKTVEPFNLFGENALIFSKEEATKILKDNSYYFFVAASILLAVFILLNFKEIDIGVPKILLISFSIFYFVLGIAIRRFKSRIASILAFISFGYVGLSRVLENGIGVMFFFSFIFLAASYRSVKASFFYHKQLD